MPINYKEYPESWFREIRPAVLERDENRCKFCNVENYAVIYRDKRNSFIWHLWPEGTEAETLLLDGYKPVKVVLTIAHLDHDHSNSDIENLAALCQRCHLKHDIQQHVRNRKYGRNWKKNQLKMGLNYGKD